MYEIFINLNNAASLAPLAVPAGGGAAALPPGMPAAPGGIYLILNTTTNTRYAGISGNTQTRFNGRMAVVNELGLATANMQPIWAWWGTMETRRVPPPAIFPVSFPTRQAGLALANRYGMPVPGTTVCPAAMPAALGGLVPPQQVALDDVTQPVRVAVGAFMAWNVIPLPKAVPAFNAAYAVAMAGAAPPPGVAAAAVAQGTAAGAANAAALAAGAPIAVAGNAAAAVTAYAGGGAPVPSDEAAVVASYYAPFPAVPPAPAATVWAVQNPVVGPPTHLNVAIAPGIAAIDLEQVFIRFILEYLGAGGAVANGALIAPLAWPGGGEPICVTWHSAAGGGFGAHNASVMWWGGAF